MNNDINIASRASLYSDLNKYYDEFSKNREEYVKFMNVLPDELKSKFKTLINKQYLYHLYSIMEIFFTDSCTRFLISYPGHIGNTKNDIDLLTEVYSLTAAIKYHAEKKMNELSYKRIDEYLDTIYTIFGEKNSIDEKQIGIIIEGKATRDLLMHNNGKLNHIYFEKTGKYSRYNNIDDELKIDEFYLSTLNTAIEFIIHDFKKECIEKYKNDTPVNTFRKMWEMSILNNHVKFDKQWYTYKGFGSETVSLNDFEWHWSGSEMALFNFFKCIHGAKIEDALIKDIPYALYRWKGRIEERIIQSWLEYQFYL
jgi:hypothetical protein